MDERLELELELASHGEGGYHVTVRSAAGDENGRLDLDPAALLRRRPQLQSTVLASAVSFRGDGISEVEAPVREVGEALFRALFDEHVYAAYKASLALAAAQGTQLRVVLRSHAPELAALPWETMYDPDAGAYLCHRDPLVRHVSVSSATRPLRVTPPLRILGVVSAPKDRQRLDIEGEKQRLRAALAPLGSRVLLRWVEGGRWADVQEALIAESWHVLHFVGHGGFDARQGEGLLALEDDQGGSDLVGADRFSDLLTLQVPPLQLVLLNSCSGAQAAADDVFSSTAASLVRTGVSAVVAMQFAVSDPAAKAFAAGFYQAIAHNRTIAEAVRIGRIGIRGTSEATLEWITPVLYLRGDDAALFKVLPGGADAPDDAAALTPEDAAREAAVPALYQQAMSKFRTEDYAGALVLFDSLLSDRDDFRDAADRREQASREVRIAEAYDEARDAEEREDWSTAVQRFTAVLDLDPQRPGVQERLDAGRRRQEVAALQEELRQHVRAEDWPAAVSVADELHVMSPADSDPDGLATRAREQLRAADGHEDGGEHKDGGEHGGGGGGSPTLPRLLAYGGGAVVAALLVAGAVWAWPDGDSAGPPAPFESEALYELARHHFEPGDCFVPQSRDDARLLWDLSHTELVLCERTDYKASFVCMSDQAGLDEVRMALVVNRADGTPTDVTEAPAGRAEPWPYQVAYQDKFYEGGRVFWEDDASRCSAILRVAEPDPQVAIEQFSVGLGPEAAGRPD